MPGVTEKSVGLPLPVRIPLAPAGMVATNCVPLTDTVRSDRTGKAVMSSHCCRL